MNTGRIVAFGEILLRLSAPGSNLLLQIPALDVWVGGAEANVAVALAQLGHEVAMVSAVPDSPLGDAALAHLRGRNVDVRPVARRVGRMGLYFTTAGAGPRAGEVFYDRAGSVFAESPPDSWDWNSLLAGADRLHLSGITPALGPGGSAAALAAAKAANALGVPVSFDGNYRESLWRGWDGRPRETLGRLVERADLLFGNHRDIALLLDRPFSGDGPERRRAAAVAAFDAFPRLTHIASTIRVVEDSNRHRLAARLDTPGQGYQTEERLLSSIVDRIGTGDAFAAGILHGLRRGLPPIEVAWTGLALAGLKHSLPGDASLFGQRDIDAFAQPMDVRR